MVDSHGEDLHRIPLRWSGILAKSRTAHTSRRPHIYPHICDQLHHRPLHGRAHHAGGVSHLHTEAVMDEEEVTDIEPVGIDVYE